MNLDITSGGERKSARIELDSGKYALFSLLGIGFLSVSALLIVRYVERMPASRIRWVITYSRSPR